MSRGTISHYSSRNLDACTVQLNSWSPFVAPSTVIAADLDQPANFGDDEPINAFLLAGASPTKALDKASRSASSGSPALHLVKCSFKQIMSRSVGSERFRWSCHPLKEVSSSLENQALDPSRNPQYVNPNCRNPNFVEMTAEMAFTVENQGLGRNRIPNPRNVEMREEMTISVDYQSLGLDRNPSYEEFTHNQGLDPSTSFKDVEMVAEISPTLGIYGVTGYLTEQAALVKQHSALNSRGSGKISMLTPSLRGWSKRHKQLSQALARGLWRWKEGSRARKRRRKGGSSRSGSGRSSDSWRARMYASEAPTVGASAAYATCSDIPMPGTDSSGELFYYGDSGGISWDPEFLLTREGVVHRKDGVDVFHAWIVSESQSFESGYGSEPGYRGDGELGYEDDGVLDEQDEEEREQLRLSPWRESGAKTALSEGGIFEKIAEEEDFLGDPTSSSESKVQHRLRRRRQDLKSLTGQRNRHF